MKSSCCLQSLFLFVPGRAGVIADFLQSRVESRCSFFAENNENDPCAKNDRRDEKGGE